MLPEITNTWPPRLISNFTGALSEDVRAMDLQSSEYQVEDGVEKLLAYIRSRLHITDLILEAGAFENTSHNGHARKGRDS